MAGDKAMLPAGGLASARMRHPVRSDIVRPSELSPADLAIWRAINSCTPYLRRAFFTPSFALACERAGCRVYVGILSDEDGICGFLPFQFSTAWHERLRLAARAGGNLSQGAGFIAWPTVRLTSTSLLRLCHISAMQVSQLMQGQEQFGLDAEWSQICHATDLRDGFDQYYAVLLNRERSYVRDTERQQRRAAKLHGELSLHTSSPVSNDALSSMIAIKRQQYKRTNAADPFDRPETLAIVEAINAAPTDECRLELADLYGGQRILAQHLGVRHYGTLSWWFPVYDPELQGISPGRLLLWQVLRHSAELGVTDIEYGEGDADYKRRLATASLKMGRALWTAADARAYAARAWQSLQWRLDQWRGRAAAAPSD